VSSTGGDEPRWSADGRQLFYTSGTTLMAVTVEAGKSFNTSAPTPALTNVYNLRTESGNSYDVERPSGRFLMLRPSEANVPLTSLHLIVNWREELRDKLRA
jgi:hypothetical protein